MEKLIFNHMETVRGMTELLFQKIPEDIANEVPNGFNNNIRWNFGHIVFVQEKLVIERLGEEPKIPKDFVAFFGGGTKPTDWMDTPPTISEILTAMTEQRTRIKDILSGRLNEPLLNPFKTKAGFTFNTTGEILLFSIYHEALHVETIKRMYQILK
ncbi:DinB family protein [Bacillus sp. 1NLA3E]|uniref:DinB family protein n=1 Tax=Bacillus sp. 1NLA3E TaxID=666686 RepID=UPI000247E633|nr:DinB family protein [Bacillus sp. 1NLA3E]AGK53731.1 hypothetical protein B1NLA3E_09865 [Bacillus sp. 1NLA3E]